MARRTRVTKDEARERVINAALTGRLNPRISVTNNWFSIYLDWDMRARGEVIWGTFTQQKHGNLSHLTEEPSAETIGRLIDIANEVNWRDKR